MEIVHNNESFSLPPWYDGASSVNENMTSPEACQAACAENALCSFWSYEDECEFMATGMLADNSTVGICDPSGLRHHECYLKTQYSVADGGDDCIAYVVWEEGPRCTFIFLSGASF